MNLQSTLKVYGSGTSEGAVKGWDTRGRGRHKEWSGNGQTQAFWRDKQGHYLKERVKTVHDSMIKKYENKPSQEHPVIKLLVGGIASGKSTVSSREFSGLRSPAVVSMDMFRSDLPEFKKVVGTSGTRLLQEEASDIKDKVLMSAVSHNNDIALDVAGSPRLAAQMDALEQNGYRIFVTYIHTPVDASIIASNNRANNPASVPADRRRIDPADTKASHDKARSAVELLFKPGRELKVYGAFGEKLLYHKTSDGETKVKDESGLEDMRHARGERSVPDIFN